MNNITVIKLKDHIELQYDCLMKQYTTIAFTRGIHRKLSTRKLLFFPWASSQSSFKNHITSN